MMILCTHPPKQNSYYYIISIIIYHYMAYTPPPTHLRPVHHDGQVRGGVVQEDGGVDGVVVPGHGLVDAGVPRGAVVPVWIFWGLGRGWCNCVRRGLVMGLGEGLTGVASRPVALHPLTKYAAGTPARWRPCTAPSPPGPGRGAPLSPWHHRQKSWRRRPRQEGGW